MRYIYIFSYQFRIHMLCVLTNKYLTEVLLMSTLYEFSLRNKKMSISGKYFWLDKWILTIY